MQMVGHELQRHYRHLRIKTTDSPPRLAHGLSQRRRLQTGRLDTVGGSLALPYHTAQQRPPPLHRHRHHIETLAGIVMLIAAALHRRLRRTLEGVSLFFFFHVYKITNKISFPAYGS
jgi:hypothetical protein